MCQTLFSASRAADAPLRRILGRLSTQTEPADARTRNDGYRTSGHSNLRFPLYLQAFGFGGSESDQQSVHRNQLTIFNSGTPMKNFVRVSICCWLGWLVPRSNAQIMPHVIPIFAARWPGARFFLIRLEQIQSPSVFILNGKRL